MALASNYKQIKEALAAAIGASDTLAIVYTEPQDRIITPSAQLLPGSPIVEYHQTMGTGLELFRFIVLVCVQRFETMNAIDQLDEYIYGPNSIATLIENDENLQGYASTSIVTRCNNLGMVQSGEDAYLGAEFEVEVYR